MNKTRINPDLENQIFKKMMNARQKSKGYASFWDWPEKPTKERGIVCDLLEAIEADGGQHGIVEVRPYKSDPPDCIGLTNDGQLVAFEVTELVDRETIARNKHGQCVWQEWSSSELTATIRQIVKKKDSKHFHGGPYSKMFLVIHTDEPLLRHADCEVILRGQNFGPCKQITDVYLLFSFVPGRESYPFLRLKTDGLFDSAQVANLAT